MKTPTKEEAKAIAALKRLAKTWPDTLWLFSASGTLCVMRNGDDGNPVYINRGGCDPAYVVDKVDIQNDGGDW